MHEVSAISYRVMIEVSMLMYLSVRLIKRERVKPEMVRCHQLMGRRIVGLRLNKFSDGKGGWATNPMLTLDNGLEMWFVVQKTEAGDYGIEICTGKDDYPVHILTRSKTA